MGEEEWEGKAYEYLRAVLNDKAMTLKQATVVIQVGRCDGGGGGGDDDGDDDDYVDG